MDPGRMSVESPTNAKICGKFFIHVVSLFLQWCGWNGEMWHLASAPFNLRPKFVSWRGSDCSDVRTFGKVESSFAIWLTSFRRAGRDYGRCAFASTPRVPACLVLRSLARSGRGAPYSPLNPLFVSPEVVNFCALPAPAPAQVPRSLLSCICSLGTCCPIAHSKVTPVTRFRLISCPGATPWPISQLALAIHSYNT